MSLKDKYARDAGEKRAWEVHPKGTFPATLIDVVDMGVREGQYGPKHSLMLKFVTTELMADGKPLQVAAFANKTIAKGKKVAVLATITEALNGGDDVRTRESVKNYDDEIPLIEDDIGKSCLVTVIHYQSGNGETQAKVSACVPLPKGMVGPNPPDGFVRKKDRETLAGEHPQDEKKRIAALWAAAEDRAVRLGDKTMKEKLVREIYEALGIKGGTLEAVKDPMYGQVMYRIKDYVVEAADAEIPF